MHARFPLSGLPLSVLLFYWAVWGLSAVAVCGMLFLFVRRWIRPISRSSHAAFEPWLLALPASIGLVMILLLLRQLAAEQAGGQLPIQWDNSLCEVIVWTGFLVCGLGLSGAWIVKRQWAGVRSPWIVLETVPIWPLLLVGLGGFGPLAHVLGGVGGAEGSRRSQCRNNLKQIGLALHNDLDTRGRFVPTAEGDPPVSWRVRLLPYLDQPELYERYDRGQPWSNEANRPVARTRVSYYVCPSVQSRSPDFPRTHYVAVTGDRAALGARESRPISGIADGHSHTILVVEACGLEIPWAEPRDYVFGRDPVGVNLPGSTRTSSPGTVSSVHPEGGHVLMGDGSVRFLSQDIDPKVLEALLTADGGETLPDEW